MVLPLFKFKLTSITNLLKIRYFIQNKIVEDHPPILEYYLSCDHIFFEKFICPIHYENTLLYHYLV